MAARTRSLLERLGLHRPELRAWAMYDWGNSAFFTTVVATVFPLYFVSISADEMPASEARTTFALITTFTLVAVAFLAPLLGAASDFAGARKRFLGLFLALGVLATGALFFVDVGDWRLGAVLFALGNVGASGTLVFYDALLPHIASSDEVDRVSASAYAVGYLGGGLLLAVQMVWILQPEMFGLPEGTLPVRLALGSVAIWWALFSLPLFRRVREPKRQLREGESSDHVPTLVALKRLWRTFHELRGLRHAFVMLVGYLIYADGVGTVFRMAAIYARELRFETGQVIGALLLTQFVGVPCAIGFGWLAGKIGVKRSILIALCVYVVACVLGSRMETLAHLYMLACMIALVQGGTQALSRSLFSSLIPANRSAEFFGLFAVCEKVAGIAGPLIFGLVESVRTAVLATSSFFVIGGILLAFVNVEAGRRAARAAEEEPG